VLGRTEEAAQRLEAIREQVERMSGTSLSAQLEVARLRLYLALLSQQNEERHVQATLALSLLEQGAASDQSGRMQVYNGVIDDALQRGATAVALQLARRSVRELESSGAPMIMGFAYWYLARAELAGGNAIASLRAIEAGQRWVAQGPDLESVYPLLRRVQLDALTRLGRTAEADSVRRTVPARGAVPRCTPGGDWKGCPD
jgi:eukaryotic-like serine/threonine-protein kinase